MLDRSSARYVVLLYVCDIVLTLAMLAVASLVRPYLPIGMQLDELGGRLKPEIYATAIVVWSVILAVSGAYDARRIVRAVDESQVVFTGAIQAMFIFAGFLYMTFRYLSRLMFVTFFALDMVALLLSRLGLRLIFKWFSRSTMKGCRVLIVGTNRVAASVGERVAELNWMGLELFGYVTENGLPACSESEDEKPVSKELLNGPVLGKLADVPAIVRSNDIAEIVIALPLYAHEELADTVALLGELPVNIKVVPDFFELVFFRSTIEDLGGLPLIGIKEPVLTPSGRLVKRLLDISIAAIALVFLSPLMALIAALIRIDSPGPVIFRQQRVGESGRLFWMYKFRTMVDNAAEQQSTLMEQDGKGNYVFQKRPDDPRLTRLGRFLRHSSIDEIPQFVNVIKGEMSLVGPRPELPLIVDNYQPWQRKRFAVPPGMTGWWQVRGRSQQPMNLRTEDDLYYIQNYSLLLDLRILWKTVGAVISGRGAY